MKKVFGAAILSLACVNTNAIDLVEFTANEPAVAAEVNSNFEVLATAIKEGFSGSSVNVANTSYSFNALFTETQANEDIAHGVVDTGVLNFDQNGTVELKINKFVRFKSEPDEFQVEKYFKDDRDFDFFCGKGTYTQTENIISITATVLLPDDEVDCGVPNEEIDPDADKEEYSWNGKVMITGNGAQVSGNIYGLLSSPDVAKSYRDNDEYFEKLSTNSSTESIIIHLNGFKQQQFFDFVHVQELK